MTLALRKIRLPAVLTSECKEILTHRERRLCVLMLLANGYSSREIAGILDSTKRGVDNDVGWWQDRLDARSRSQVAAMAVARSILLPEDLLFDGTQSALREFRRRHESDCDDGQQGHPWRSFYRFTS